jgi:VanZ family protein
LALGMATAVGSWDEYLQSFIPLKVSSQWDLVFDVLGAGLGQGLYGWFRSKVARTP